MLLTDRQLGMWRSCLPAGQLTETQPLAHTALKVEEQRPKNPLKTTPKPQQKVDSNPYQLQAGCPSGLGLLSPGRFPKKLLVFCPPLQQAVLLNSKAHSISSVDPRTSSPRLKMLLTQV